MVSTSDWESYSPFLTTGCVEHLDFLNPIPDTDIFQPFEEKMAISSFRSLMEIPKITDKDDDYCLEEKALEQKSTPELLKYLKSMNGMTNQATILRVLLEREGLQYRCEGQTVCQRMEALITKAGVHKKWSIVRLLSALLKKGVDSLAPSITSVLVRGKQVTLGVFKEEEVILDKPIAPSELIEMLYRQCKPYDIRQAVLQQEIILAIGKLIVFAPRLFDGILKIRIGWILQAMVVEMENMEGRFVDIHSLSPHQVKEVLYKVLTLNTREADRRTPFQKRQLDGALNRVPKDFYCRIWKILERTPGGIKVAGLYLPQQPTLSDMTMNELNFSLLVEQMLCRLGDPVNRQGIVEAVMVVSTILERNPELTFDKSVMLDTLLMEAYAEFKKDNNMENCSDEEGLRRFFNMPPNVRNGTTAYLSKVVMKHLLTGDFRVMAEDMCCVT